MSRTRMSCSLFFFFNQQQENHLIKNVGGEMSIVETALDQISGFQNVMKPRRF